jgi:UMF1 family MFS transporter
VLLVVLMPVVGALADRTGCKRGLLLGFGYLGAASCVAMVYIRRTDWVLGSVLFIVAFLSYSCANVVYNSLLPDLADPDLRDRVSSVGWAAGYLGSAILLTITFGWSFVIADSALLARLSLCRGVVGDVLRGAVTDPATPVARGYPASPDVWLGGRLWVS